MNGADLPAPDIASVSSPAFAAVKRSGVICRYFLNSGDCFYGTNCQYSHDVPLSAPGAVTVATADSLPQVTDEGGIGSYHLLDNGPFSKYIHNKICIFMTIDKILNSEH